MTQDEWEKCSDPQAMLRWLHEQGKLSDRKARLFAVACGRRIWPLLDDERSRRAVEVAERFADGLAGQKERAAAERGAAAAAGEFPGEHAANAAWWTTAKPGQPEFMADQTARFAVQAAFLRNSAGYGEEYFEAEEAATRQEHLWQSAVLREIFGNPFRRLPAIDAAVLGWNDGTVKTLAQTAYEERSVPSGTLDNVRLAVLADALEEAGCTDAELLGHLRGPGPHVRGCWAVDLLLQRE